MEKLGDYFQKYYSDKFVNYGDFYDELLGNNRNKNLNILEIGIGTLNFTESNMIFWKEQYKSYRPGASLRALRDYFINSEIYGVDIQPDCMIEDELRIHTFLFDSRETGLVENHFSGISFDIIIEDGDHHSDSQIRTFENLFKKLNPGGVYVLEDLAFPDVIRNYFEGTDYDYHFTRGLVYILK